ncbi:MAG TPA: PIN domain-containing protein [Methanomassiliicoccales archaeon]|nr:PIN domain-containing protein [Methanomassiliicoccales archaeon]HPR97761.1 PIN domain-containing protein [Methanomassiliicoccales archaeon]
MEVDKEFITVVLNESRMADKGNLIVRSDLLDLDLLALDLDHQQVQWVVRERDYDEAYGRMRSALGDQMARDIPTFLDLREALQASLFMPPTNLDALMAEIYRFNERRGDPYRFPRQTCIGLDTNLLYRRLFSRLLLAGKGCNVRSFDPQRVQVLIPSMAEEELSRRVGKKYDRRDVDELRRAVRDRIVADDLFNCLNKNGRKALNGQAEVVALKQHYNCWSAQGGSFVDDKEARDDEMLRSVAAEMLEQRVDVLFLTNDDKTRAHANAHKVPSMLISYPYEVPLTISYDPWLMIELLYDLSILHTSLSLKGTGIRIKGEWMGKTVDDYRNEKVRVTVPDGSVLSDRLARDQRVISAIKSRFPWKEIK